MRGSVARTRSHSSIYAHVPFLHAPPADIRPHQPQCHFHIQPMMLFPLMAFCCVSLSPPSETKAKIIWLLLAISANGWKDGCMERMDVMYSGCGACCSAAAPSHHHHRRDVRRLQRPPFPQQNRRCGTSYQSGSPECGGGGGGAVLHAEVRRALRLSHDVGDDAHVPGRGRSLDH